jgi:ATP-dependent RNA circularization protein (DNA/RNA ligase family)
VKQAEFFRFPHTPHLQWFGRGQARGDKVLSPGEADILLRQPVIVEEKLDGANVGISLDERGDVRAQNRGAYLTRDICHPQFKPLFQWLSLRRHALQDHLPSMAILFGEWCYAVHSVRYTRLPDWFLAFDVYDHREQLFWSVERRDALAQALGVALVPRVAEGVFKVPEIVQLLGPSRVSDGPAEGIYVKWQAGGGLEGRAKVVRATFAQGIEDHWSQRPLEVNRLSATRK